MKQRDTPIKPIKLGDLPVERVGCSPKRPEAKSGGSGASSAPGLRPLSRHLEIMASLSDDRDVISYRETTHVGHLDEGRFPPTSSASKALFAWRFRIPGLSVEPGGGGANERADTGTGGVADGPKNGIPR